METGKRAYLFLDTEILLVQQGRPQTRGNRLGKIRVRDLVRKFD